MKNKSVYDLGLIRSYSEPTIDENKIGHPKPTEEIDEPIFEKDNSFNRSFASSGFSLMSIPRRL